MVNRPVVPAEPPVLRGDLSRAVDETPRGVSEHSPEWLQRFSAGVGAMPEVMEVYRTAGEVDYVLRVSVADMAEYDTFYKRLIAIAPMKNVTSRFAMERIKHSTAYPLHPRAFRDRRAADNEDEE